MITNNGSAKLQLGTSERFINPWRACAARVTVVVLCVCVCVCVCLSGHAILAVRVFKSIMKDTYHCVKRQICGNIKMAFFFKKNSYSKVRAFLLNLGRGGHF